MVRRKIGSGYPKAHGASEMGIRIPQTPQGASKIYSGYLQHPMVHRKLSPSTPSASKTGVRVPQVHRKLDPGTPSASKIRSEYPRVHRKLDRGAPNIPWCIENPKCIDISRRLPNIFKLLIWELLKSWNKISYVYKFGNSLSPPSEGRPWGITQPTKPCWIWRPNGYVPVWN